jgi:hypothetical protein
VPLHTRKMCCVCSGSLGNCVSHSDHIMAKRVCAHVAIASLLRYHGSSCESIQRVFHTCTFEGLSDLQCPVGELRNPTRVSLRLWCAHGISKPVPAQRPALSKPSLFHQTPGCLRMRMCALPTRSNPRNLTKGRQDDDGLDEKR